MSLAESAQPVTLMLKRVLTLKTMKMMKKTKIVATVGPASDSTEKIEQLILAGMNVVRLNLSHGTPEHHTAVVKQVREIARRLNLPVAIMADTPGPALRTGELKEESVTLQAGAEISLIEDLILGDSRKISIDHKGCIKRLKPGMTALLANGEIRLKVKEIRKNEAVCLIENSGVLRARKRVNFPEIEIPMDLHDDSNIDFAIELDADYLAASFVQRASDVEQIQKRLSKSGIGVVAKIETRESVKNIDEIIEAADGVMVARGDLGVELPFQEVPQVQKQIVQKCNRKGKPVIIATQMLKSMTENPTPTRAEVADVANAILDGTDAVMLSEETAIGEYPVEAVKVMVQIAQQIEQEESVYHRYRGEHTTITEAIGESACDVAEKIDAAAIIPSTTSGSTAKLVAKFRPRIPIVAVTYSEKAKNKLALVWGVFPLAIEYFNDTDKMLARSIQATSEAMRLPKGETVVITAGVPFGVSGTTNLIKVEHV